MHHSIEIAVRGTTVRCRTCPIVTTRTSNKQLMENKFRSTMICQFWLNITCFKLSFGNYTICYALFRRMIK